MDENFGYFKMSAADVITDAKAVLQEIYRQREQKRQKIISELLAEKKWFSDKPRFKSEAEVVKYLKQNRGITGPDKVWDFSMFDLFCDNIEDAMNGLIASAERVLNTTDPYVFVSANVGQSLNMGFSMRGNANTVQKTIQTT